MFTPEQIQAMEKKLVPQVIPTQPTVVSTPTPETVSDEYFHFNLFGKELNIKKNMAYIVGGIAVMAFVYFVIIRRRL